MRQVRKSLHDTIPKLLSILRLWFWIWSSCITAGTAGDFIQGGRKNSWVKAKGRAAYAFTQWWLWQELETHLRPRTAQGTWPKEKQCRFLAFFREQKRKGQNSALTQVYTCMCEYWFYKSWVEKLYVNAYFHYNAEKRGRGGEKEDLPVNFSWRNRTNQGNIQGKTTHQSTTYWKRIEEGHQQHFCQTTVFLCLRLGAAAAQNITACGWLECIWRQVCFLWNTTAQSGTPSACRAPCGFVALLSKKTQVWDNLDKQTFKRAKLGQFFWNSASRNGSQTQELKIHACAKHTESQGGLGWERP